jgi:hypothetical protein
MDTPEVHIGRLVVGGNSSVSLSVHLCIRKDRCEIQSPEQTYHTIVYNRADQDEMVIARSGDPAVSLW